MLAQRAPPQRSRARGLLLVLGAVLLASLLAAGLGSLRDGRGAAADRSGSAPGAAPPRPADGVSAAVPASAEGAAEPVAPLPAATPAPLPPAAPGRRPQRFQARVGAGSSRIGEARAELEGAVGSWPPRHWLVEFRRRWAPAPRGWHPLSSLRLGPRGYGGALRWSRALLPGASPEERRAVDGTGLDLHLETRAERPWAAAGLPDELELAGLAPPRGGPPVALHQTVELVLGPKGQAHFLNLSLPVGLLFGASAGPGAAAGEASRLGPVGLYFRFASPGLAPLEGWTWEAELEDETAGLLRGSVSRPWVAGKGGAWSLEHARTHGVLTLPLPQGGSGDARPAVVPTTRLRAGSDGGGAACSLESAQAGLGDRAWGGSVEANRHGWRVRLCLAGGSHEALGRPRYTVTTQAQWQGRPAVAHEFKWALEDGQGFWVTVLDAGGGRRVNAGLEIR